MPVIRFTDWVPDAAPLGNPGAVTILNALPGINDYKPFPSFGEVTDALDARARGAIDARDRAQNVYRYAGDAAKLYALTGASWGDVSKGGGYTTGSTEQWEFLVWKDKILCTNFSDNPQSIVMGGANFGDLTTSFKARRLFRVADHVVFANTFDATDGNVADRVRWSAFDDETDYVTSPTTGSGARDLKGGPIQRGFGGQYGVLFSLTSTYRMDWVGAPAWFQILETLPGIGLLGPRAAARIGATIFAWSGQGFVAITNGTGPEEKIGAGRVDSYAAKDLDASYLDRISCASDPRSGRVFWAYPGGGNVSGRPNKLIFYDTRLNKWGHGEVDLELLWQAGGISYTLEQLDSFSTSIDDLTFSLDSSVWKGGDDLLLAAFDETHKHGYFAGDAMLGTLETGDREVVADRRSEVQAFRPLIDGGSFTAQVGTRNKLTDPVNWSAVLSPTDTGRVTKRANARYHRFRVLAADDWEHAIGVQIDRDDIRPAGKRG